MQSDEKYADCRHSPPAATPQIQSASTLPAAPLMSHVSPSTHKETHVTPLKRIAASTAALIMIGGACQR